jgi:hypothetical protein
MPSHPGQLPQELLPRVFEDVQLIDLSTCLFVCRAWHIPAKQYLYKHVEFKRFPSIHRFNSCMQSVHDHPGLFVRKITFAFSQDQDLLTFKQEFERLVAFIPLVETLTCSEELESFIILALHGLSTPLNCLSKFPYSTVPEYNDCAELYKRSLKQHRIDYSGDTDFGKWRNFPRLQSLILNDAPVRTIQDLEYVCRICRNLKVLYAKLLYMDVDHGFDNDQEQTQVYPRMEHLQITSDHRILDLKLLIPFLRKFNHLKRLEISSQTPLRQLVEIESLFGIVDALPSVSFLIKRNDFEFAIDLPFLRLIFQRRVVWKHTSLIINASDGHVRRGQTMMHYSTTDDKSRELVIFLPEMATNNPSVHDAYTKTFAPYVNTLQIGSVICSSSNPFLHAVLTHCTALSSLILYSGRYVEILPQITNTTLHELTLYCCIATPDFLKSVSTTCIKLRNLTLCTRLGINHGMNRILMPQTELHQLDLDLGHFKSLQEVVILTVMTDKIQISFRLDYKNNQCTAQKQRRMSVLDNVFLLDFKKLKRLRILGLNINEDIIQNLE